MPCKRTTEKGSAATIASRYAATTEYSDSVEQQDSFIG